MAAEPHADDRSGAAAPGLPRALGDLLEALPDGVALLDASCRVLAWNGGLTMLTGVRGEGTLGQQLASVLPCLASELPVPLAAAGPLRVAPLPGRPAVECRLATLPEAGDGGPVALCILRDVSELRRVEEQLAESERKLRDFVGAASDWFWEMDEQLRYSYLSDRYQEATGLSPESRRGHRRGEFRLDGPDDGDWATHLADLAARRPFRDFTFAYLDSSSRRRVARVSGRPIFAPDGTFRGYRGVGRDITDQVRAEAQIRHMAQHDALTGLPNRVLFHDRLTQALAMARRRGLRVAVLWIDLDDFKSVNDGLGHAAGDEFLRQVAARMAGLARESDTVARLGGDEFAVIQTDLGAVEGAAGLAERILRKLAEPASVQGADVYGSASIGIAVFPDHGGDPDELLRHADLALYRAKAGGRNAMAFFHAEMGQEVQQQRQLEQELRQAVDQEQLSLHYQPQIDLRSGRVVSVEALARWQSAEHGEVAPSQFIPLAEKSGLILAIGRFVLRRACLQARAWHQGGLKGLRVAVNLSSIQFAQRDLADEIARILEETGIPPACLELEITESVLMADTEAAIGTLRRLDAMGITLTIDDFGTGYCSLSYLRRFPLQRIKIDRTFIRDLCRGRDDGVIARAMISLGHNLGLRVLAEGVEASEQLAYLREQGCDEAQGFLIAPPVAGETCGRLLLADLACAIGTAGQAGPHRPPWAPRASPPRGGVAAPGSSEREI